MKYLTDMCNIIASTFKIDNIYFILIIESILLLLILKVIGKLLVLIYTKHSKNARNIFLFNQRVNIIINMIIVFGEFIIWEDHMKNIITIISFISAGVAIAIREIILNLFAGIYIKTKKPFKLEDRIEINEMKGDVVVINALSFKILEVGNRINGEQSSGLIINVPNSFIFSHALKNYTTAFKYIWNEMTINLSLDANVEQNKKEILKIVKANEVIASIPKKMNRAIEDASLDYRIYYNHLEPIIYTSVVDDHIELNVRYLVHPKKTRFVEDDIWTKILTKYHENKIDLLKKTEN